MKRDRLIFILNTIKNRNIGRVILHQVCLENGYIITEYKLRTLMNFLNVNNYIKYDGGRKCAKITEKGLLLVDKCDLEG